MGIFGGSGRAERLKQIAAAQEAEAARVRQEAAAQEQARMHGEEMELQKQALAQTAAQNAAIKEQMEKQLALASRPAPGAAGESAEVAIGDSSNSSIDVRKRGRAALRIDLAKPAGSGSTGLNVARG